MQGRGVGTDRLNGRRGRAIGSDFSLTLLFGFLLFLFILFLQSPTFIPCVTLMRTLVMFFAPPTLFVLSPGSRSTQVRLLLLLLLGLVRLLSISSKSRIRGEGISIQGEGV